MLSAVIAIKSALSLWDRALKNSLVNGFSEWASWHIGKRMWQSHWTTQPCINVTLSLSKCCRNIAVLFKYQKPSQCHCEGDSLWQSQKPLINTSLLNSH